MKSKLLTTIAVAGVSLGFIQGASGAIMALYDFGATGNPESYPPPNYFAPGFSGGVVKGKPSWNTGGSNDGTLGDVPFADGKFEAPFAPAGGDGHLRIGQEPFPGMPFPHTAGPAVIRVTNSSGMPWDVGALTLVYDAAADLDNQEVKLSWSLTGADGSFAPFDASGAPIASIPSGDYSDYGDYSASLGLLGLNPIANGDSIYFRFAATSSNTIRLDNIGLVPEPGSLLVFGSMLGAALTFRRRQRTA